MQLPKIKCTPNVIHKELTFGGVFFMTKFSIEIKLEVIKYMLEGNNSTSNAVKKFGISKSLIKSGLIVMKVKECVL